MLNQSEMRLSTKYGGICWLNPLQMQVHEQLLRKTYRIGSNLRPDLFLLSNCFILAFPTELIDKYPRIFMSLTRISILRIVLAIIFRKFCEYAK